MVESRRGRPRQFDEEAALEEAMQLFWRDGYKHTSLDDLMDATGMARTSIYRTFTDKRTLFLRALRHYGATTRKTLQPILMGDGSALLRLRRLVAKWEKGTLERNGAGCLNLNSVSEFGHIEDEEIRTVIRHNLSILEDLLTATLREARSLGELTNDLPPRVVARSIVGAAHAALAFSRTGVSDQVVKDLFRAALAQLR